MTADNAPIVNYTSAVKFVIQILDAVYFVYLSHNRTTKDPSIVPVSRGSPLETLICINFLLMTQIYTGRSKFLHSISLSCQQMSREIFTPISPLIT